MTWHNPTWGREVSGFDWSRWTPGIMATLVFVLRDDQVLLIKKKTGLGKGKVNGPGGKKEADETWEECAFREVKEELNIEVQNLTWAAELRFLMSDCPDILCHAFISTEYEGSPTETREATPFWCSMSSIPWGEMWADDVYWLPRSLLGERILGCFSFEGEALRSMNVQAHGVNMRDALP